MVNAITVLTVSCIIMQLKYILESHVVEWSTKNIYLQNSNDIFFSFIYRTVFFSFKDFTSLITTNIAELTSEENLYKTVL